MVGHSRDAAELVTESSCDDDPRHLNVPLNHDLLDLVAKIWHGRHCFEPHLFLGLKVL